MPREVRLKFAHGLTSNIQPYVAACLLANPSVSNDREILDIIAHLPGYSGDAYKAVRAKAQDMLGGQ